jgi:hypothetical protein
VQRIELIYRLRSACMRAFGYDIANLHDVLVAYYREPECI